MLKWSNASAQTVPNHSSKHLTSFAESRAPSPEDDRPNEGLMRLLKCEMRRFYASNKSHIARVIPEPFANDLSAPHVIDF